MRDKITRRPFPLGKLRKPRAVTVRTANRPPLVMLNRYPGQVIGVQFRLPQLLGPADAPPVHLALGIIWASPSRWWR